MFGYPNLLVCQPKKSLIKRKINTRDIFNITDPSSVQDVCHMSIYYMTAYYNGRASDLCTEGCHGSLIPYGDSDFFFVVIYL